MNGPAPTTRFVAVTLAADAAWPAWAITLAVAAILALVLWTYRAAGQRSRRAKALAVLRAVAAVSLLALLARPTLVLFWQRHPKPVLILALDTSASMARQDVASGATGSSFASAPSSGVTPGAATSPAGPVGPIRPMGAMPGVLSERSESKDDGHADPRLSAAVSRLTDNHGALLARLADAYHLQLAAVSDRVVSRCTIDSPDRVAQALEWLATLKPDGRTTDLAADIREILATIEADRTCAGIVLLSDGRRTAGAPLSDTAGALAAARCPAIAVPVGSDSPLPDLALGAVQAPSRAFVGEPVAIRGRLELAGVQEHLTATVQLLEESTGRPVADRPVALDPAAGPFGAGSQSGAAGRSGATSAFAITYKPDKPGITRLLLTAKAPLPETNLRNNRANVQIDAVAEKIRVLYVEQEPRFEYRYLANLLIRDPAMICSVLLLSADPDFPQEGTEPIRRFPASLQELNRYDVVLIGDVDPRSGWIDAGGMRDLAAWVEQNGGGLGWIAGPRVALNAWTDTPLGKVLPVRPADTPPPQPSEDGYRPLVTPQGAESSIFLLDPEDVPPAQVIASLPEWYWSAAPVIPTPAAETLAVHPRQRTVEGPAPLVVIGHYGAGQTFYAGSDDMWRWRRFRDLDHWRTFWLQTVRWLASPRKLGAYRKVVFEATPEKVQAGQPVNLDLRVRDEMLAAGLPDRLGATIRDDGGLSRNVWLQRPAGLTTYTASVSPDRAGVYTAEVQLPAAAQPDVARPPSAQPAATQPTFGSTDAPASVLGSAPTPATTPSPASASAPAPASTHATVTFTVELVQAETADSPADPAALTQWVAAVQQAGAQGYVLGLDSLTELASLPLPAGQPRRNTIDLRLWDNALALLLVSCLFLAEWSWRRARGMV